jgi:hypothetical protein
LRFAILIEYTVSTSTTIPANSIKPGRQASSSAVSRAAAGLLVLALLLLVQALDQQKRLL